MRSITHMKSYKGPSEFRNVKHQVNPTLFMSKHQFKIIEDDEDLEILEENTPSSYVDQNSQERIRLPSGQWILRNRITGEQRETSLLDDAEPERQEEEIENVDEVNPNVPEESSEQESSETVIECTIHCKKPVGKGAKTSQCIHCGKKYHIQCIGLTERRAAIENYICIQCEQAVVGDGYTARKTTPKNFGT